MRKALMLTWVLIVGMKSFSQHNVIDSLHNLLKKAKSDTGRAIILNNLSNTYQVYKPDSALLLAQEAFDLSTKHHFLKTESWALNQMAGAFSRMGNNAQALAYYIQQLKIEEERKDIYNIAVINMNIALVYNSEKDTAKAIAYILQADSVITQHNISDLKIYSLLNTGEIFEKANRLPGALAFTKNCYDTAAKYNDSLMMGSSLNNLGNVYLKTGEPDKAINSYKSSVPFLLAVNDYQTISEGKVGLAKAYQQKEMNDSALQYASEAYRLSSANGFLTNALNASRLLSALYKKRNNADSAFAFSEIMVSLRDSIQGIEKIKQLESITIQEQLRQQHLLAAAAQEKEEQRQKLQLLAIGIFIPIFFLASMYISRKKVNRKFIEFSGILSLLLLFEYITLFIHPFVVEITHHSPLLEIIIFVAIAAMVVPAHHKIESWFIRHLAKIHEKHSQAAAALAVEEVNNAGDLAAITEEEKEEDVSAEKNTGETSSPQ